MSHARPIRGILFDKDGTLFHFQQTWAPWLGSVIDDLADADDRLRRALAAAWGYDPALGQILPGAVVIAGSLEEAVAAAPEVPGMTRAGLLRHLEDRAAQVCGVEAVPLAGLLKQLKALGLALGVATNESEGAARAQIGRAGIAGFLDYLAGYDSGHGPKPAPGMCRAFAERMNIAPAEVAMVGDSRHDLQAARAAGMRPVGVLTGLAPRADLAPLAEAVLEDIGDLPDWLLHQGHSLPGG